MAIEISAAALRPSVVEVSGVVLLEVVVQASDYFFTADGYALMTADGPSFSAKEGED